MPPSPFHLPVDMISYAKETIIADVNENHMAKKYGDEYIEESSDANDDRDRDSKQVECSDDDHDLNLAAHRCFLPMNSLISILTLNTEFNHLLNNEELD